MGIYSIATVSLNLTNGYTGLFSLGHAAFMAIGAYTSTLLAFPLHLRESYELPLLPAFLTGADGAMPFIVALIAGGVFAALSAILIGAPVLRLRGHYLSSCFIGFHGHSDHLAKTLKDHGDQWESMPYLLIPISIGPIYGSSSQYMWFGE